MSGEPRIETSYKSNISQAQLSSLQLIVFSPDSEAALFSLLPPQVSGDTLTPDYLEQDVKKSSILLVQVG